MPNGAYSVYSDWLMNAPAGGIAGFNFTIYDDIPVDPAKGIVFSRPGEVKKSFTIQGDCGEVFYGTIDKGSGLTEDVYQYYVNLDPQHYFAQEKDKIYWLSIQAILPTNVKQWGWHEAIDHRYDYAVQKLGSESGWYVACTGHDMAFELTSVPEPGSLASLAVGICTMSAWAFRSRKRTR
ncbi:MAG: PEP-CTERM sorting domain-containing protein [Armatimonadetes bacterium]|nr:PEP-CTERM sorting domain-containing protein [Armatimonadota bacterium]